MLNSRNITTSFQPIVFNQYLSNVKSLFADNSRADSTTISTERILFSFKFDPGNPSLRLFEVLVH